VSDHDEVCSEIVKTAGTCTEATAIWRGSGRDPYRHLLRAVDLAKADLPEQLEPVDYDQRDAGSAGPLGSPGRRSTRTTGSSGSTSGPSERRKPAGGGLISHNC